MFGGVPEVRGSGGDGRGVGEGLVVDEIVEDEICGCEGAGRVAEVQTDEGGDVEEDGLRAVEVDGLARRRGVDVSKGSPGAGEGYV